MAANIFYRTFKNMDGPGICSVWNQSCYADIRGEKVRDDSFDQFVASKLFFDPSLLVVAVEKPQEPDPRGISDGRVVGFNHGGFGPNQEMKRPSVPPPPIKTSRRSAQGSFTRWKKSFFGWEFVPCLPARFTPTLRFIWGGFSAASSAEFWKTMLACRRPFSGTSTSRSNAIIFSRSFCTAKFG